MQVKGGDLPRRSMERRARMASLQFQRLKAPWRTENFS
jgi:hypothetical protein